MKISNGLTFLVLFLLALTRVSAPHTQQPARRDDSAWNGLSGPLLQQFVDGVLAPAAGIAGDTWGGILDEFIGPDTPNKSPPKEQPPQSIPGDQPGWINPSGSYSPQLPENSPFIAPQTSAIEGHGCDSPPVGAPDDRDQCAVGLRKIIHALDCADKSQNAAIGDILARTVRPGTKTSTTIDNDCGVIFWTGELTEEGAEKMREIRGVLAVVPDVTFREDYTSTPYVPSQKRGEINHSGLALERRHFVKRDTIVRQKDLAVPDLSFISAPEGISANDCNYVYRSVAGEGTFVYVIDIGLDRANAEFSSGVIKRWIYAYDTYPIERVVLYKRGGGHGSCVASKVAGQSFGVAKKTSLIIVKTTSELSSFMDAINSLNDVRLLAISGEYKPGYNIVTMQQGFRGATEIDNWSKIKITRQFQS